ncbi:hypothetical protein K502DRAFT_37818 [Neoconidiobolus thromboides FSU 785]|nr:hypothetical protein K502DRAFT_37818 [Neoconidiobolus thromboides FSU 785]
MKLKKTSPHLLLLCSDSKCPYLCSGPRCPYIYLRPLYLELCPGPKRHIRSSGLNCLVPCSRPNCGTHVYSPQI